MTDSAATSALTVSFDTSGGGAAPTAVALLQGTTTTAYDGDGNVASLTDADGNTTTYGYDDFNRVISQRQNIVLSYGATPTLATTSYQYLCPGQVGGADFVRPLGEPGSKGVGRFSFSHKSMAA